MNNIGIHRDSRDLLFLETGDFYILLGANGLRSIVGVPRER